ncbi:hypothetical protein SPRG_17319 [Saprolegnia parasitica CBS 223.65]|uniref:Uncharacterized protein n=1 Tax=Saprolegnia parasitica (strain CBS 223.65) TaxID=695850 RepID=A0A067BSJ8_SAPPC|nr:hypothetical protein SPRG_17319 [Saprolegnia parasitica CBS 223.65]KDO17251.1 hypothetical protein SPRG_17319 [Saprolegnia parasitica CBS 223.65]|eukprot:XP_012212044.1 hypothetical protein SPRG_17319 [Saprolegnia parasitica CBS 223.65]
MEPSDAPTPTDAAAPPISDTDDNASNEQFEDAIAAAERAWTIKLDEYARRVTALRASTASIKQAHQASTSALQKQLHEAQLKHKSLVTKWTKEKEARAAEKEWIADAWPSEVALPPLCCVRS